VDRSLIASLRIEKCAFSRQIIQNLSSVIDAAAALGPAS
jgi:hypothetical protein